jgi:hypothetical protein
MVLGNPITTAGGTFGSCAPADRMVIASSSGNGNNAAPPVLCGTLTGSHSNINTSAEVVKVITDSKSLTFALTSGLCALFATVILKIADNNKFFK